MLNDTDRAEVARIVAETVRSILGPRPRTLTAPADPVHLFLDTRSVGHEVRASELYEAFVGWWAQTGRGPTVPSATMFGRRVMGTGRVQRRRAGTGRAYVVLGVPADQAA